MAGVDGKVIEFACGEDLNMDGVWDCAVSTIDPVNTHYFLLFTLSCATAVFSVVISRLLKTAYINERMQTRSGCHCYIFIKSIKSETLCQISS